MKGREKMNTFFEYTGITGKARAENLNRTLWEFLELAGAIRRELGKQAYLLDKYISCVLEGASVTPLCTAAERGFHVSSELRGLCHAVMGGKSDYKEHPMYERVKEHIKTNPLGYQESTTRQDIYYATLTGDFLEYAAEKFAREQYKVVGAAFDIIYLRNLYREISTIIGGEEQMERLNMLLRHRFLFVTPMAGFMQGLTNSLLYSLIARDAETSKLVFQLMLEQGL